MRWSLFWVGTLVIVTAITVHTLKTAERPVVADGVIQRSTPSEATKGPHANPDRAEAYASSLGPARRRAAQKELNDAGSSLFAARAAVAVTEHDILEIETNRAAAQQRWEVAMERLYGPTWRDKHESTIEEARQAVDGMASRYGYRINHTTHDISADSAAAYRP